MPVETGTTLAQLDDLWPLSGDATSQGDDHLRLIKSVLKSQFPGLLGDGFAIPLVVNEYELNYVAGATKNIPAAIAALEAGAVSAEGVLSAPVGTRMMFFQATAPTGWIQVTDYNDYMLRVVNTAGGGSGGADSPIDATLTHSHTTVGHALTVAEMPLHSHRGMSGVGNNYPLGGTVAAGSGFGGGTPDDGWVTYNTTNTGSGSAHNHGPTNNASPTFKPKYLNTIIARKA